MMLKVLRTIFILFPLSYSLMLSNAAYGKDDIAKYYDLLNKAELSICNANLNNAKMLYDDAYKIIGNKMSSKHLYNYFIVCADLKQWNNCSEILCELKSRRWDYDQYKFTLSYFDSTTITKLDSIYKNTTCDTKLDSNYLAVLNALVDVDQTTNRYFRSNDSGYLRNSNHEYYETLTEYNIKLLRGLFIKNFPTDYIVGTGNTPTGLVPYYIILRHNIQINNHHYLDTIFYNAVIKGDFPPEVFDYLISGHYSEKGIDTIIKINTLAIQVPTFPYSLVTVNDSLFQFPLNNNDKVDACNLSRKKLVGFNLATVDELRTKIIFQYYNPKYFFLKHDYITNFDDMPLPQHVKKNLLYIKP